MAEAVAEVMSRYIPNGIVIESTQITESSSKPAQAVGLLRVCGYLPNDASLEETRSQLEEALRHLGRIKPLPSPDFRLIKETNWMEAWKKHYRPIPVGEGLMILPAWVENPDPARVPIKIDPGMAFGTGTHPTTQMSLILLEEFIKPGEAVLDIGCGSGILSIAAHKLGAGGVYGVDIDPSAVENAQKNASENGIEAGVTFEVGSTSEILEDIFPIRQASLVVANLLAHILLELLEQRLEDLVSPNGLLLLSGILEENEPEMMAALKERNLIEKKRIQVDDWVALALQKS
jgi:ribosomal protein L11 methyltransferase